MTREGQTVAALVALWLSVLASPAHAAPGWTPKETLPGVTFAGSAMTVLAAGDGTKTVVSAQTQNGHSAIVAVDRPPGGRLGPLETLSQSANDECTAPAAAVDRRGDAIAVWQCKAGTTNRVASAFRPAGGAWQAPVPVSGDTDTIDMTPQVAIAPSGEAIAVW